MKKNTTQYLLTFLLLSQAAFAAETIPVFTKAGVQLTAYGFASLMGAGI